MVLLFPSSCTAVVCLPVRDFSWLFLHTLTFRSVSWGVIHAWHEGGRRPFALPSTREAENLPKLVEESSVLLWMCNLQLVPTHRFLFGGLLTPKLKKSTYFFFLVNTRNLYLLYFIRTKTIYGIWILVIYWWAFRTNFNVIENTSYKSCCRSEIFFLIVFAHADFLSFLLGHDPF